MPELPEVETIKRGLERLITGRIIQAASSDNQKSFPNAESEVDSFLLGATITGINRRAKVLIIDLSSQYSLIIHLKMTGQLVFIDQHKRKPEVEDLDASSSEHTLRVAKSHPVAFGWPSATVSSNKASKPSSGLARFGGGHPTDSLISQLPDKSTRVTLSFTDGSKLFFNDQRKFGWMRLLPTLEVPNIDFMRKVGPEPLADDFTVTDFIERSSRRAGSTIKAALLDQTVVAGVGNIYADESLYAAKIHPAMRVKDVPISKLRHLFRDLQTILQLSIDNGGSTDRNYVDAEGKKGEYLTFAKVFRKQGQLCSRCKTPIIKIRVAGRGTHICPNCQQL